MAVGTAGLAGCTGSGEPDEGSRSGGVTSTPVTPSPGPNPRPSLIGPTAPARPVEVDQMTPAGAAAAARYFIELYGYVLQTGDLTEWDAMSFPTCDYCATFRSHVVEAYAAGESIEGGDISADVVAVHDLDELIGGYPVDVRVSQSPTVRRDAGGAPVETLAAKTTMMQFETVFQGSSWTILDAARIVGEN
ncbi:MAG TPA: DUF6318 family protein [Cellulomonadaceae bacterium]|nr:DUF6318 family protein [Cellulomonadaceae bacterium]